MIENKRELDSMYQTYKGLTLSELEEAFSTTDTQEEKEFFFKTLQSKTI